METKHLFGYELDILPIEDFKEYYEKCNTFSSFSEKKFLSAVGIPGNYFLEQPEGTRKDLLVNKECIIPEKYDGKYIVVLKKDNIVLNSCRVDLPEFEDLFERVKLDSEKGFTLVRDFTNDGYLNLFKTNTTLVTGEYNLGVFVDIPLMCNKLPVVHNGYYYVPKEGEDLYKSLYLENTVMNLQDYQHLSLLIDDSFNTLAPFHIVEDFKNKHLLRELEEILLFFVECKIIPKGYIKKICKYVDKKEIQLTHVFNFVDLLLSYDNNIKGYKKVNLFRNCVQTLNEFLGSENG